MATELPGADAPEPQERNRDRTKEGLTVRERIHRNFRWSVATMESQPVPGGPKVRSRILMFGNKDETDIESFPLSQKEAAEIAMALLRDPEQDAAPAD